jgi:D-alanyl-D-alanine carboxypeptidase/D-alanyl-D-alanine-endopeptidase (penicillin-binding protein 4)
MRYSIQTNSDGECLPVFRAVFGLLAVGLVALPTLGAEKPSRLVEHYRSYDKSADSSVHVIRLHDGETLFAHNDTTALMPASVTKLFTAATALEKFGPAHAIQTNVHHSGRRQNQSILGDLYIKGNGDPFLVNELLWQLAADLRHQGLREITGDLVIDNSLFGDDFRDDSRASGTQASSNAYDAPVSAFGVNFNTLAVAIYPGLGIGKPAYVGIDPYPLKGVQIENSTKTGAANVRQELNLTRKGGNNGDLGQVYASGIVPADAGLTKLYRAVGDPVLVAGEYVRSFLSHENIRIVGKVRAGVVPKDATPLATLRGYEMRKIVQGLNTFSNNYIADVLLRKLGADFGATGAEASPGTFANGLKVVRDYMQQDVGIKSTFVIENGSGLSTANRLSARQITQLLQHVERQMTVFPDFFASLPAIGWDGTMKKRFSKGEASELKGQVRAKTGTLSEPKMVAGLGGYFRHPRHGLIGFAIIQNGKGKVSVADMRQHQDQALLMMLEDSFGQGVVQ